MFIFKTSTHNLDFAGNCSFTLDQELTNKQSFEKGIVNMLTSNIIENDKNLILNEMAAKQMRNTEMFLKTVTFWLEKYASRPNTSETEKLFETEKGKIF